MSVRSFRLVGEPCYHDYLEEIREGLDLMVPINNAVEAYFKERGPQGFSAELKADIRSALDAIPDTGTPYSSAEHRAYFGSDVHLDPIINRVRSTVDEPGRLEAETRKYLSELIEKTDDFDELTGPILQRVLSSNLGKAAEDSLLKQIAKKTGVSVSSIRPKTTENDTDPKRGEHPKSFVRELNRKHAVVPLAGRVYVMNQEYDPAMERPMVTFSAKQDFQLRYLNRKTVVEGEETDIGTCWLNHSDRRQYDGVLFDPGGNVPGYYNLFQGFGVTPRPGSYGKFQDFILEVICNGHDEIYDYVWSWLAHLFQRPKQLPETALILRGKQGTGKNTFVDAIGRLVGTHFIHVSSLDKITGRFSGHLADVLLVFANEAIWGGDKSSVGPLKTMITDHVCTVERKGKDIITMRNFKRLIAASNEDWVVPRDLDDRRFLILDIPDTRKEDIAYFSAIHDELNNGGFEALLDALLTADIDNWMPMPLPRAAREYGWDIKIRSASSVVKWWFSCLEDGYIIDDTDRFSTEPPTWPDVPLLKKNVHNDYLNWCHRHTDNHPVIDSMLGRELRRFGVTTARPRGMQGRCYIFPSLDESRRIFSEAIGIPMKYWTD